MSSLRNAISRRAHKERAQPHNRKKFGILEKHKDYVVRAKSFHQKEETLKKLREKAAFKNPDEFSFAMINSRMVDGVHRPKEEAREIKSRPSQNSKPVFEDVPKRIKKKMAASYKELEERKKRVQELEKLYNDMSLQKELQKPGRKRKLREDEVLNPSSRPVYKWRAERKR
ncbi:Small-subunit processome Utp11 protein [Dioscorea alata]|uniref:Small-subunit processome Utp11 protein n=1 Tax=Dioscorea alata TaxID=55571 RepID=A0ACB7UVZ4_DIOAL|nr:Small-subunit processome Utp11 protein [Dioscorea alata]